MKRVILLFLILLVTTSCSYSYTSKIALPDQAPPSKAKYDLKAAIVVTPEQMEQSMTYNCALISIYINFKPYPEIYQLIPSFPVSIISFCISLIRAKEMEGFRSLRASNAFFPIKDLSGW